MATTPITTQGKNFKPAPRGKTSITGGGSFAGGKGGTSGKSAAVLGGYSQSSYNKLSKSEQQKLNDFYTKNPPLKNQVSGVPGAQLIVQKGTAPRTAGEMVRNLRGAEFSYHTAAVSTEYPLSPTPETRALQERQAAAASEVDTTKYNYAYVDKSGQGYYANVPPSGPPNYTPAPSGTGVPTPTKPLFNELMNEYTRKSYLEGEKVRAEKNKPLKQIVPAIKQGGYTYSAIITGTTGNLIREGKSFLTGMEFGALWKTGELLLTKIAPKVAGAAVPVIGWGLTAYYAEETTRSFFMNKPVVPPRPQGQAGDRSSIIDYETQRTNMEYVTSFGAKRVAEVGGFVAGSKAVGVVTTPASLIDYTVNTRGERVPFKVTYEPGNPATVSLRVGQPLKRTGPIDVTPRGPQPEPLPGLWGDRAGRIGGRSARERAGRMSKPELSQRKSARANTPKYVITTSLSPERGFVNFEANLRGGARDVIKKPRIIQIRGEAERVATNIVSTKKVGEIITITPEGVKRTPILKDIRETKLKVYDKQFTDVAFPGTPSPKIYGKGSPPPIENIPFDRSIIIQKGGKTSPYPVGSERSGYISYAKLFRFEVVSPSSSSRSPEVILDLLSGHKTSTTFLTGGNLGGIGRPGTTPPILRTWTYGGKKYFETDIYGGSVVNSPAPREPENPFVRGSPAWRNQEARLRLRARADAIRKVVVYTPGPKDLRSYTQPGELAPSFAPQGANVPPDVLGGVLKGNALGGSIRGGEGISGKAGYKALNSAIYGFRQESDLAIATRHRAAFVPVQESLISHDSANIQATESAVALVTETTTANRLEFATPQIPIPVIGLPVFGEPGGRENRVPRPPEDRPIFGIPTGPFTIPRQPEPPKEPPVTFGISGSNPEGPGLFNVEVRRGGRFSPVTNRPVTLGEAFARGTKVTRETAAASFRITPAGGGAQDLRYGENRYLGRGYYASRKEKNVYIQQANTRISTAGEKFEITTKGRFTSFKKKGGKRLW